MFNAATLLSTTATPFIAYNDDSRIDDRRSSKKSRRMALDRVLLRDHRREMQEALRNHFSPEQEGTTHHNQLSQFLCEDCLELGCTCSEHSFFDESSTFDDPMMHGADSDVFLDEPEYYPSDYYDYGFDDFYAYGPTPRVSVFHSRCEDFSFFKANGYADLIDAVLDINLERNYSVDPEELKLHDFFWEAHEQQDMEPSFEGSKTRRQFVEMQKGHLRKFHGRRDSYYASRHGDLNSRRVAREREDYLIEMSELEEQASEIEQARRESEKHRSKRAIANRMQPTAELSTDNTVQTTKKPKKAKKSRRKSSKSSAGAVVKVFKLVRPENRTLPRLTLIGHIVGNVRSGTRFVPQELAA